MHCSHRDFTMRDQKQCPVVYTLHLVAAGPTGVHLCCLQMQVMQVTVLHDACNKRNPPVKIFKIINQLMPHGPCLYPPVGRPHLFVPWSQLTY